MSDLTDALLTAVLAYGAPALGLVLFSVALGIPQPHQEFAQLVRGVG